MSAQKQIHEGNRNRLMAFICMICECIKNFFQGWGFKTTATLAAELSQWLDSHKSIPELKIITEEKKVQESPPKPIVKEEKIQKETKPKTQKDHALEAFLGDNCSRINKNIILQDLKYITEQEAMKSSAVHFNKDPTISMEGLLKALSKTPSVEKIDLSRPEVPRGFQEVLSHCTNDFCYRLIDWVKNEPTYNIDLLKSILPSFIKRLKQDNTFKVEAVKNLMTMYMMKEWNKLVDLQKKPILPTNDPLIIEISAFMLQKAPNDDKVGEYIEWMWQKPELDIPTCKSWINVFVEKEKTYSSSKNLSYEVFDKLYLYLTKHKSDWLRQLEDPKNTNSSEAIARFLKKKLNPKEEVEVKFNKSYIKEKENVVSLEPKLRISITPTPSRESSPTIPLLRKESSSSLKRSSSKTNALEDVFRGINRSRRSSMNIVYGDVKYVTEEEAKKATKEENLADTTVSFTGLIKFSVGLNEHSAIDLNHEKVPIIFKEVLSVCTNDFCYRLIDWVKTESTYNVSLLKCILPFFVTRLEKDTSFKIDAVRNLMIFYMNLGWNKHQDMNKKPTMPINDAILIDISAKLLQKAPNDDAVGNFIEWMWLQPEFDLPTCKAWCTVFMDKESTNIKASNLFYPVFEKLLDYLVKNKPDMLKLLQLDEKVGKYMTLKVQGLNK